MQVIVCRHCGLTMSSGINECRRCKRRHFDYHDLYHPTGEIDYQIRLRELSGTYGKKLYHPVIAAVCVLLVAVAMIAVLEYNIHPDGELAVRANHFLVSTQLKLAKKVNASKSKTM